MRKLILATALAVSLSGCTGLDAVGAVADVIKPATNNGTQVETQAQVGKDASQSINAGTTTRIDGDGATVSHVRQEQTTTLGDVAGAVNIQNIAGIPAWAVIVMILGWMAPTPTTMIKSLFRGIITLYRRKPTTQE